jgi:hypothetical protein
MASCTFLGNQGIGAQARTVSTISFTRSTNVGAMAAERFTMLEPLAAHADLVEHLADAVGAFAGAQVAFQEVAAAFQAAGHQHAVDAFFEGLQDVLHLDLAGAGRVDDAHVGRVLHALGARQVGGGVGAVVAAEGDDFRLPALRRLGRRCFERARSCAPPPDEQFVEHGGHLPGLPGVGR